MTWIIDWSKVTTFEHIKELLQCCDMQPRPSHPMFFEIQHLCKGIDEDGKPIGRVPIGMREMTLTPEAVEQLERILAEPSKCKLEPKQMPEIKEMTPDWYDENKLRRAYYADGYTGWVIDLGDGTCRFASDPLLGEDGPKWGDRVPLLEDGDNLPKVNAKQILEVYNMTNLEKRLSEKVDALEDTLRRLASYVGNGGYNADEVDPAIFEEKIRDGIDRLIQGYRG